MSLSGDFDRYHRALSDAVVDGPDVEYERLVWIMAADFHFALTRYCRESLADENDGSEFFGIPIIVGEPANDEPFELKVRDPH